MSLALWGVATVFAVVYVGMFLGGLPALRLDRTGVAVLGAIAMLPLTGRGMDGVLHALHLPTLALLFAFMVIAAQLRHSGFFAAVVRAASQSPGRGHGGVVFGVLGSSAGLSAVFSNDVVCLAMAPWVLRIARARGLAPVPLLVGLACASNIGSAATLIGNPQVMLIGSVMQLPFNAYARTALWPVLLSLLALGWAVRRALREAVADAGSAGPADAAALPDAPLDRWQAAKGLAVALGLLVVFLFTDWPREVAALVGAGLLLLSRRLPSAQVVREVDGTLLLLFIGLFVVNDALAHTGLAAAAVQSLAQWGLHLQDSGTLMAVGVLLSNLVSNVPAVMLLLPHVQGAEAATALALSSTFAGNLLLVGSIANLIVADSAAREGVPIGWREHARLGLPVGLFSLLTLALPGLGG